MDRARAGGGEANADLTGEFGMGTSHERRHLFVPHLYVLDGVTRAIDRADDTVNSIARITVNPLQPPLGDSLDQKVARGFSHGIYRYCWLVAWKSHRAEQGAFCLARTHARVPHHDWHIRFREARVRGLARNSPRLGRAAEKHRLRG